MTPILSPAESFRAAVESDEATGQDSAWVLSVFGVQLLRELEMIRTALRGIRGEVAR